MYYIYILKNQNGDIYVGQTSNIAGRVVRHNKHHGALFTKNKPEFTLVYQEEYTSLKLAMRREL